jgi:hypothetical protein
MVRQAKVILVLSRKGWKKDEIIAGYAYSSELRWPASRGFALTNTYSSMAFCYNYSTMP